MTPKCVACGKDLEDGTNHLWCDDCWDDTGGNVSWASKTYHGGTYQGSKASKSAAAENQTPEKSEGEASEGLKVPDLTEYVIGYREWDMDEVDLGSGNKVWRLMSPFGGQYAQTDKSNRWASKRPKHVELDKKVGNGYYCYHSRSELSPPQKYSKYNSYTMKVWKIPGVVKAWGEIAVYHDGFRASDVEIVLLGFDPLWRYVDVMQFKTWAKERLKVRVCPWIYLKVEGLKYGSPIPKSLYPKGSFLSDV